MKVLRKKIATLFEDFPKIGSIVKCSWVETVHSNFTLKQIFYFEIEIFKNKGL